MNRAKLLPLSIQPGSRETLQTPEPLTSPTEAPRFYFSFINSGCYWYEQGVEGRTEGGKEGAAAGTEICSGICYNYPHIISNDDNIAERVEFVCPLALPTASFQNLEWWINKKLSTGWLFEWHVTYTLSLSLPTTLFPSFSRWLAHLFAGKITSARSTFRGVNKGKKCNQQNWGKALYFVHFNSPMKSSAFWYFSRGCMCVCILWQGDFLVIRAESSDRLGKRPALSVNISSL